MQKLALTYEKELKGKFSISKLNFLFVFQVNCPGCFLYGIPLVNKLYNNYKDDVSFLGISTAFEDFELNSLGNTKKLIYDNELVGETKKAFEQQDIPEFTTSINFPVAMDKTADTSFDLEKAAAHICAIQSNYNSWPDFEKTTFKNKVINYLKSMHIISMTFTLNQLRGTPSMLVFNEQYEILFSKFGHAEYNTIASNLDYLIEKFGKDA